MDLPLSYEPDVTLIIASGSFKGAIAHPLTSVFVPDSALGLLPSIALSSGQAAKSLDESIENRQIGFQEVWQMRSGSVAPYTTGLAAKKMIRQPGQV